MTSKQFRRDERRNAKNIRGVLMEHTGVGELFAGGNEIR